MLLMKTKYVRYFSLLGFSLSHSEYVSLNAYLLVRRNKNIYATNKRTDFCYKIHTSNGEKKLEHKSLKYSSQCEHILAFWLEMF